ncbi:uncharacterized protein LOC116131865 [Pistacia vera]|uniref:uncharacterized protein LOC116131865 n=1 Tax=Pistacia vera TaxID=55513 RepID=UPI001263AD6C|nr:uncharacterized protein LOC116131865 [Pistacia vera]
MSHSSPNLDTIVRPIDIILDGSNYNMWAQNMEVFLRGRKLCCYVSGDILARKQQDGESLDKFTCRLEDWHSIHYKILSGFINTYVPSIHSLLPKLGNAQAAWDFLAKQYNCIHDASLLFQLETKLYQTCQESDPHLKCSDDIELFATYRDRRQFMHFMMALREDFESTRASLLHHTPLPTLEIAVAKLISEENHHSTMKMQTPDSVVAAIPQTTFGSSSASGRFPSRSSKTVFYKYCKRLGHSIVECQKLKNKNQSRDPLFKVDVVAPTTPSALESAAEPSSVSITLTTTDIEALIHQVLSQSSSALSVTLGTSLWFFDSACCNHMTSNSTIFSQKSTLSPNPIIYTADGSHLSVSQIGSISYPTLSVDNTYLVPKLSLNLLSVGQLCELGLQLAFSNVGVDVQDPQRGQLIGIGSKIARLFELTSLQLPSHLSRSIVAPTISSQLGHASIPRVHLLASQDNAMEYNDKTLLEFLNQQGTVSHRSCLYTSQQNGRVKRKHRHILDIVRALLLSASLPEKFWGKATLTAVYTINGVPSPIVHNKSPYELLYGIVPNYSLLCVFGCACFVTLPPHERTKLEPHSRL